MLAPGAAFGECGAMMTLAKTLLTFPNQTATDCAGLAASLAAVLLPGDAVLLSGPVGAGKTHFARALIQTWLAEAGLAEDVPSPTFTLVQTYTRPGGAIWHADLYRLSTGYELLELGLDEAFDAAICLVEWPDRLGSATPPRHIALHLDQGITDDLRDLQFQFTGDGWAAAQTALANVYGG